MSEYKNKYVKSQKEIQTITRKNTELKDKLSNLGYWLCASVAINIALILIKLL